MRWISSSFASDSGLSSSGIRERDELSGAGPEAGLERTVPLRDDARPLEVVERVGCVLRFFNVSARNVYLYPCWRNCTDAGCRAPAHALRRLRAYSHMSLCARHRAITHAPARWMRDSAHGCANARTSTTCGVRKHRSQLNNWKMRSVVQDSE